MPELPLVCDQSEAQWFPRDLSQGTIHVTCLQCFQVLNPRKERVFLMTPLSGVRVRAALSPLSGFLSSLGLIALPLLSSGTHCGYEDIHHSGLSGFKVFQGKSEHTVYREVKKHYRDF